MNINVIQKGFTKKFEQKSPYDFYTFYPHFVESYDFIRSTGHIVSVDDGDETTGYHCLTHSDVRNFIDSIDDATYTKLITSSSLPNSTVYDYDSKKIVVRHLRGDYTTVSSTQDINVYYNNPLFGTTATDVAHNFYMCWVGGYIRNQVYYGDLIVPVARTNYGPIERNESVLPIHIVRGILPPNRLNMTALLVEDWLEYRKEYDSDGWIVDTTRDLSSHNSESVYEIDNETDYGSYRVTYNTGAGTDTEVVYFKLASNKDDIVTVRSIPSYGAPGIRDLQVEKYNPIKGIEDHDDY